MPELNPLHAQRAAHRAEVTALIALLFAVLLGSAAYWTGTRWYIPPGIAALGITAGFGIRGLYVRGFIKGATYVLLPPPDPTPSRPPADASAEELEEEEHGDDSNPVLVTAPTLIPVVRTRLRHPVQELPGGLNNETLQHQVQELIIASDLPGGAWEFLFERHLKDQGIFEQHWTPAPRERR